ncbi:hypothetical protein ACQJBY_030686 [Aegilops geniculata]
MDLNRGIDPPPSRPADVAWSAPSLSSSPSTPEPGAPMHSNRGLALVAEPRRPELDASPPRQTSSPTPLSRVPVLLLDTRCRCPTPRHIETDAAATQYDYGVDDPSLLPEQPDVGAKDPDATVDDTPTTPEVPSTTCSPLTTTRSSLGGSQAGGLRLFRSVSQFVLAFLRQLV